MITVLGASGFIGSHLARKLAEQGIECSTPGRDEALENKQLGDLIYCIGLTADFRSKPFETVEAHVCKLLQVLRNCDFDSLVYLSSARVYEKQQTIAREEDVIQLTSFDKSDLYNISKIMGESLAFACGKKARVVRLSNVYGDDFTSQNFLSTVLREAVSSREMKLYTSLDSEKDYLSIHDAVDGLIQIATRGEQSIYNLASGVNLSNRKLIENISELTGCHFEVASDAQRVSFPEISIERMRSEFGFQPSHLLDNLSGLVDSYRNAYRRRGK